MDFFGAERRARTRTTRLLVLFGLAVLGTVAMGYLLAVLLLHAGTARSAHYRDGYAGFSTGPVPIEFWQPELLVAVAAATCAVIGLASLYKWSEFSGGGSSVAESVGGRKVDPHTTDPREHQLLNVVEEMAIASGLPVPAVYILDEEGAINAFAAGLTTNDSVVTVTRGTLEKLSRDELQGVIGHEFSHILNGDMRLNIRISAIIFGILVIGLAGRAALWSLRFGRVRSGDKGNGSLAVVLGIGLGLLIVGYVGYFFGKLIQASVSRQREFLADASSVQFTRNPAGITGALKKIGGLGPGSSLDTHKASGISHFFFAQAFESNFGGLWATHPPLEARIRAIDPQFDGRFPEVGNEAAPAPAPAERPLPPMAQPPAAAAFGAVLAAAAGTLTAEAADDARSVLSDIPSAARAAARSPHDAPFLVYGLLLDEDPAVRRRQLASIASSDGGDALHTLERLEPALRQLKAGQRLPLLQLALPALKTIPASALGTFAGTLDALVQADGRVTPFEFTLQRILLRALAVNRAPVANVTQVYSFQAVTAEISVVLSALARAASADPGEAAGAFALGASQLKLVEGKLALVDADACSLPRLDAALDKLVQASGPIRHRVVVAAAHVVGSDGVVNADEAELIRAVAASLDVPVPPLTASSAA